MLGVRRMAKSKWMEGRRFAVVQARRGEKIHVVHRRFEHEPWSSLCERVSGPLNDPAIEFILVGLLELEGDPDFCALCRTSAKRRGMLA